MADTFRRGQAQRRRPAQALYRTRQVLHALRPRLVDGDLHFARAHLSEGQWRLFAAMERRDQRHAVAVARHLEARGVDDRDLIAAALLHDCGKGDVPVWLRVVNVVSPATLRFLASVNGNGTRGAAYRLLEHASLSARLAAEVGSSEATVRLIEWRVEASEEWKLALLQAADDVS